MSSKHLLLAFVTISTLLGTACAPKSNTEASKVVAAAKAAEAEELPPDAALTEEDAVEEFNPFAPEAEQQLEEFDKVYESETNESANVFSIAKTISNKCKYDNRFNCGVYVQVVKSKQEMYLYVNGKYQATWKVSTGRTGYRTPNMEGHPNGRIYKRYNSIKFPGGDYYGLGNMPYAVFIKGGFAIHGTPQMKNLGQPASHGCIRLHPDNAWTLNNLVRQYGIANTWFTVQEKLDSDK